MNDGRLHSIRNIMFAGPSGSGKTSLLEALLAEAGALHALGSVESKNTLSDFTEEEREVGHSTVTSIAHAEHNGLRLTFIDTPGHPEYVGQVAQFLPAVESFCLVLSATEALDGYSRKLMEYARDLRLCRAIIVNKIDADGAEPGRLLGEIREIFGKECLPVNLPAQSAHAVMDVFFHKEGITDLGTISIAHQQIIDQVVELDEGMTEQYLTIGEAFDPQALHDVFERALREDHLIPVCFVSARTSIDPSRSVGIRELLDFFERLLPSPLEGNFRGFSKVGTEREALHVTPRPDLHTLVHVCALRFDPFRGKLAICRVHQGTLTGSSSLFVGTPGEGESKKPLRPGHIFRMHGSELLEIKEAQPGDICVIGRAGELHRDAVLHSHHEEDDIRFESVSLPQPLIGRALRVKRAADEQRFAEAVSKLGEEDPTLRIERDPVTNEIVLFGIGEVHLRTTIERLTVRSKLDVEISIPKISYRETIRRAAEGHYRHKKQTGGAGQFAEVFLRVEPLPRGAGFEFVSEVVGGSIPTQFIPATEKGIRSALLEGFIAGFPIQDVRVTVYDGKHHSVDSKEIAFFTAGKRAFLEACRNAAGCLLEPIMKVTVTAPLDYIGDLTGHLISRRGRILDTTVDGAKRGIVTAEAPLASLQIYQSELRGLTSGQGQYQMEFVRYDAVPDALGREIADHSRSKRETESATE